MSDLVRISAETGACIGSGNCAGVAPEIFDVGDDGVVELLRTEVDGSDAVLAAEAVDGCPAFALRLEHAANAPESGS